MASSKGNQFFVWLVVVLLAVGLVGFGSGGLTGSVRSLGRAGDKDISVQRYANALNDQLRSFAAQFGIPLTFAEFEAMGLDQAVLGQIVAQRAIDNEVARLGLSIGDETIGRQIRSAPEFQGLDGTFSRDAYRLRLQQIGMSEPEFEASLREDIARGLLQRAVIGGVPPAETYAQAMVAHIGERRSVTWARLAADRIEADLPEPTEAELEATHSETPESYTAPEIRHIAYAWLSPAMIIDDLIVDEEAVRQLYEDRIVEFVQEERRLVERLVFGTEEQAQDAMARLEAGETDFEGLVAGRGLDLSDIDLGDLSEAQLGAAGPDVFAAATAAVVGPLETSLGPALFRVNAVLAAQEVTFDEAEGMLRAELAMARARRVIGDQADGITDLLAGGATLEDLVERTAMEAGRIDWSAGDTTGIAAYEAFRMAAATLAEAALPSLIELEDGGLLVLSLEAVTPPRLRPLDEVREAVASDWQQAALAGIVLSEAEEIARALRAGEAGPGIGFADDRLVVTVESQLMRRNFLPGTPPGFMTEVFAMEPGDVRVLSDGEDAIILRLDTIAPAETDDPTMRAEAAAIAERASTGIAQDMYELFARRIIETTDISINDAAVDAVHGNFR
ncbi:MAG: SurA N-terminal domain-containing protein [Rubellimicrobium sp.]|nr:SurA N-terminal domain-containing protein [Rubellimicrobium sp.]